MGYRMQSRKGAWERLNSDAIYGRDLVCFMLALHFRSKIQIPMVTDTFAFSYSSNNEEFSYMLTPLPPSQC